MDIKKMEYVKKKNFFLSEVREYWKALRIYFSRCTVLLEPSEQKLNLVRFLFFCNSCEIEFVFVNNMHRNTTMRHVF